MKIIIILLWLICIGHFKLFSQDTLKVNFKHHKPSRIFFKYKEGWETKKLKKTGAYSYEVFFPIMYNSANNKGKIPIQFVFAKGKFKCRQYFSIVIPYQRGKHLYIMSREIFPGTYNFEANWYNYEFLRID